MHAPAEMKTLVLVPVARRGLGLPKVAYSNKNSVSPAYIAHAAYAQWPGRWRIWIVVKTLSLTSKGQSESLSPQALSRCSYFK